MFGKLTLSGKCPRQPTTEDEEEPKKKHLREEPSASHASGNTYILGMCMHINALCNVVFVEVTVSPKCYSRKLSMTIMTFLKRDTMYVHIG